MVRIVSSNEMFFKEGCLHGHVSIIRKDFERVHEDFEYGN
jgi:hypothetical protein